eukprot:CAMPEP_0180663870 /NCGR_PEP_ID=MMETSP1037_2-20121125/60253_1 /TAXON_ID=632150 /ORGANISM="Azadinium spinosum, Strain 3D9" /LENGTH=61 /DNA_ID=CAMNT_0022691823 /DNA_START=367 /DNA_END=552 /DNA_ORIENTATION=-
MTDSSHVISVGSMSVHIFGMCLRASLQSNCAPHMSGATCGAHVQDNESPIHNALPTLMEDG